MSLDKTEYDAVAVGSGPNGLAAAILFEQQLGLSVLLIEGKDKIGGGLRTEELTLPEYQHDLCSAVHPMWRHRRFLKPCLQRNSGRSIYLKIAAAHPFDNGTAAVLKNSINHTAKLLGADEQAYLKLIQPIVNDWPLIADDVLGPLSFPKHPIKMAQFGLPALSAATTLAKRFKTDEARGLFGGMAAHSIQPLGNLTTSAIALVLMAAGHLKG